MLIERLDAVRERWNLLEHPFYKRWSCGELSRDELALLRRRVQSCRRRARRDRSEERQHEHAREEAEHVALWDDFAAAFDADTTGDPSPETRECVVAWTAPGNRREALAVLYAIEAGQPAVSKAKLDGLAEHYGVPSDEPGAAYFALHAELDHEHAAESRQALEETVRGRRRRPPRRGGRGSAAG